MREIKFIKMVASGNDFIVTKLRAKSPELRNLARNICDRKFGVGANGLLVLEKSKIADVKMRIFNADGSEAEMCGNGARCTGLYTGRRDVKIETKAGIIESKVNGNEVKIKLTDPKDIKLDILLKVNNRNIKVNFINTGVPHAVIFVEGLEKINIIEIGRYIRYHKNFAPRGTNVDFIEVVSKDSLKIRTYERGVEDETLACGTGAVASAIILTGKLANWQTGKHKIYVHTKSGEILKVYFNLSNKKIHNVWLQGKVSVAFEGQFFN